MNSIRNTGDDIRVNFDEPTYAAWIANAEIPYDSLIPLIHQIKTTEGIFRDFLKSDGLVHHYIQGVSLQRLATTANDASLTIFHRMLQEHNIQVLTILEESYPHCLREISDPPAILFYQGNLSCLNLSKKAAMVGSRAASYTGLKAAHKIAAELSRSGVSIVSGLAYGIDTESHRGCLDGGSPTIAVMGCGLDNTYPSRNDTLKKEILSKGGLILSEYAPGAKPIGHHFPYRNRIISGLCDAVILMEARIRSGSMTTISHALKQGKEVYAYPGDPASQLCDGNHLLLREGAHYFTEARDILSDMNWLDNIQYVRQNNVCPSKRLPESASELAVFKALEKGDLGFDELLTATGMASSELLCTITVLQIRKMIDLLPGKRYQIRND